MGGIFSGLAGCVAMCVGSCCASVSCKLCSCACIVPPNIASNIYVITLALISMWALLMRSHGSDIAFFGGYNASEASYMEMAQHYAKQGTGVQHSWNSRFWCASKHPDAWVVCCEDVCGGNFAVYRFSFVLCLFFTFLAFLTIGVTRFGAKAHRGFWFVKAFLLVGLMISTLFIDNYAMETYREFARYLSWCFLAMQVVMLLDFGYTWNSTWLGYAEESGEDTFWGWKAAILFSAAALNLSSLGMWIFFYNAFGQDGCPAQQTVISLTIILSLLWTVVSVSKFAPHGTLLTSSVITAYSTFLCYSALSSHPDDTCNPFKADPFDNWSDTIVGCLVAAICLVMAARTATAPSSGTLLGTAQGNEMTAKLDDGTAMESSTSTSINGDKVSLDEEVQAASYQQYHFMMVACSFYMAMLITGWSSQPAFDNGVPATIEESHKYDTDIASFWVKIVTQWFCLLLYGWTLIGPYLLRHHRDFGIEFDFD